MNDIRELNCIIGGALLGVVVGQYLPEGRPRSAVIFLLAILLAATASRLP